MATTAPGMRLSAISRSSARRMRARRTELMPTDSGLLCAGSKAEIFDGWGMGVLRVPACHCGGGPARHAGHPTALPLIASSATSRRLAPVAQLDRALPSEGRGQGFESLRARQKNQRVRALSGFLCDIG